MFPELHAVLSDNVGRLEEGAGGFVVVAGEPGIGKAWAVDTARRVHTGTTLIGRASTATTRIPLWPLHQTFLARPDLEPPPVGGGGIDQISSMVRALADLARRQPTLLAVHRLDCADTATLAVLEAVAGNEVPGMLCVATVRSEPRTASHELVDELLEHDLALRVDLAPVNDSAVHDLVVNLLLPRVAPSELVERVVDLAGGLPRLAERIVRTAQRRGVLRPHDGEWSIIGSLDDVLPTEASSQVEQALVAASATVRDVSMTAALLGSASLVDLASVTALDRDTLIDATHRGVELGLLRRAGESVVPRCGLVRDAVLHSLIGRTDPTVLDRLVSAASSVGVQAEGFERGASALEQIGLAETAAHYRLRMATRAFDDGELATVEAQLRAVNLEGLAVNHGITYASLRMRSAALVGAPRPELEAAHHYLGTKLPVLGEMADSLLARAIAWTDVERARDQLTDLRDGTDAVDAVTAAWTAFLQAVCRPTAERQRALEARIEGWLERAPDVACTALRHVSAVLLPTAPSDAASRLELARALAQEQDRVVEVRRAAAASAQLELLRGATPLALNSAARALCDAGDRIVGGLFQIEASLALAWECKTRRAFLQLTDVYHATKDVAPGVAARALVAQAGVAAVLGDEVDVGHLLGAADQIAPAGRTDASAMRVLAAVLADDLDAAIAVSALVGAQADPLVASVAESQWFWVGRMLPVLRVARGEPAVAPEGDEWAWTRVSEGWSELLRAAALGTRGEPEAAVRSFVQADDSLSPYPFQQLLARRLAAEVAVRDGWATRTIELTLLASLARFAEIDLEALESRCRALLRTGGFAVPRYGGFPAVPIELRSKGVTTREMEVVRLLASGATTSEAAAALFVSDATITSHVSNMMRKLGYSSRDELLGALASSIAEG